VLASRVAARAPLRNQLDRVALLLDFRQDWGAHEQAKVLTERLPGAGPGGRS
jgi:hypothetical protein